MGEWLLGAVALMLIVEGAMPFASPSTWRGLFERALRLSDGQLRFMGLTSMLLGLTLLLVFAR
jgi:uncharacterized protein YjeT (DUF2065 family)